MVSASTTYEHGTLFLFHGLCKGVRLVVQVLRFALLGLYQSAESSTAPFHFLFSTFPTFYFPGWLKASDVLYVLSKIDLVFGLYPHVF